MRTKRFVLSPVTKEGSGTPAKKAPTPKPFERAPSPGQKTPTSVQKTPAQKTPTPVQKAPTPAQKTPPSQKPPAPKPGTAPAGYGGMPPEAIAAMKAAQERAQAVQKQAQEAQKAKPRTYVVQAGDSLSKIAKKILGDAKRWPEIYELNKDKISDPNLIYPGQELKLPAD